MKQSAYAMLVYPSTLIGSPYVPQSKSVLIRRLLCAALCASHESDLDNILQNQCTPYSDDVSVSYTCARALHRALNNHHNEAPVVFEVGESATLFRMLIVITCSCGLSAEYRLQPSLSARIRHDDAVLRQMLGEIAKTQQHAVDMVWTSSETSLVVRISRVNSSDLLELSSCGSTTVLDIPASATSQYLSGALIALSRLPRGTALRTSARIVSAPYVQMTQMVLDEFGVKTDKKETDAPNHRTIYSMQSHQLRMPNRFNDIADASCAIVWAAAAGWNGQQHKITLPNSPESYGVQADAAHIGALATLRSSLSPQLTAINITQAPDTIFMWTVAALLRPRGARTQISGVHRLLNKETNRLDAAVHLAQLAGGHAHVVAGRLLEIVSTGCIEPFSIDSRGDHRLVMAASMLGALSSSQQPVRIGRAHVVSKSYPQFFKELQRLGARCVHQEISDI